MDVENKVWIIFSVEQFWSRLDIPIEKNLFLDLLAAYKKKTKSDLSVWKIKPLKESLEKQIPNLGIAEILK